MRKKSIRLLTCAAALAMLASLASPAAAVATPEDQIRIITTSPEIKHEDVKVNVVSTTGRGEHGSQPEALPGNYPFDVLQLNLCNSGHADCYENGLAVPEGADVIRTHDPEFVTLNEICETDVNQGSRLLSAMQESWPAGDVVISIFGPVYSPDNPSNPIACTGGRGRFGNAVIAHVRQQHLNCVPGQVCLLGVIGTYPANIQNGERRGFVCFKAVGVYAGCGTHLDAGDEDIAMGQCHYLMGFAMPVWVWGDLDPDVPTVVGGDLNLHHGSFPPWQRDVQECVPDGWFRKGDDDVQHIMATQAHFGFFSSSKTEMEHTDHPAWLVHLWTLIEV